jgi:surface protein
MMASYRDFLPVVSDGEWVRPSDWLALPTVTAVEQKFVGLHGVWEDGDNVVAFLFRGAYTVDWGDGVVENVADNVKAEHQYTWASIPAGTLTSEGYRQVIITVTPNGGNLTLCNFQQRYTARNQAYTTGFLDVTLSMPNASGITFGGLTVTHANIERATIVTIGTLSNVTDMFRSFYSLQSVPLFDTSAVTVMNRFFSTCYSIKTIPLFNTSSCTNFANAFEFCNSLVSFPLIDTSSATVLGSMFFGCISLENVPLFDMSSCTSTSNMFNSCYSLLSVPLFNTSGVIGMASMFQSCHSLQSVPLLNTASVTDMNRMFRDCFSLQAIPALSTAKITTTVGTDFDGLFASNNRTLSRCEMVFARTVGFGNAGLGVTALVEIFTNLVDRSATTSATITITNNWGASLLTAGQRDIALNKNWLITG